MSASPGDLVVSIDPGMRRPEVFTVAWLAPGEETPVGPGARIRAVGDDGRIQAATARCTSPRALRLWWAP